MSEHGQTEGVDRAEIERQFGRLVPPEGSVDHRVVNREIHYAMYSVFSTAFPLPADDAELRTLVDEAEQAVADTGVVVRGWYDVGGLRADADLLVWWHSDSIEAVQAAYHALRRTTLGAALEPVWSNVGLHRPAEFNKRHLPGFLMDPEPRNYCAVYPFVRSYGWYVMDPPERNRILRNHGMAARDYPDVLASTISAFALGDYEFLLALEADTLHRLLDLMREFRATEARLHVREDVPFFTGPLVTLGEWAGRQPRA